MKFKIVALAIRFLMIFERACPSPEQLQSRPHGTLSSPLLVHEQRHRSSDEAPESAGLGFLLVFL